jgi:hypothetical protein
MLLMLSLVTTSVHRGTEKLLKDLTYTFNAVLTSVCFSPASLNAFASYKSGIFQGCAGDNSADPRLLCNAVVVEGFGQENGVDFWLVKNSQGVGWGEGGYFRLQRGVGMCNVGRSIGVVTCGVASGNSAVLKGEGEAEVVGEAEGTVDSKGFPF